MPGTVIGKNYTNGFPGSIAEMGDQLVKTFPNTGDAVMNFGSAVFSLNGGVAVAGSTGLVPTAALFSGVSVAHVQSANTYTAQNMGTYDTNKPVPVLERGGIVSQVNPANSNAAALNGPVYIRIANGTATKPVGGIEAANDATTYTATVTTQTTASASIVVSSVANLAVGMTVSGTGIPAGAIITAINAGTSTITISAAATTTASSGNYGAFGGYNMSDALLGEIPAASNIGGGANPDYSIDAFKADFPQFTALIEAKTIPASLLTQYINIANASIHASKFGELWQRSMGLYVAHLTTL